MHGDFSLSKCAVNLDVYGLKELTLLEKKSDKGYEYHLEENQWVAGKIIEECEEKSQIFSLQLECIPYPYDYFRVFRKEQAAKISIFCMRGGYKALAIRKYNPFWTEPVFLNDGSQESYSNLQHLLLDEGNGNYIHFMPIANEKGIVELEYCAESGEVILNYSPCMSGQTAIVNGAMIVSHADDPYKAVQNSFTIACKKHLIHTPLKKEKEYPEFLKGLGWCTWNAFYHDVTAEGIRSKLQEFRQKNVPIKWIIIDDGWSQVRDFKLLSLYEDRSKFPEGLKAFIQEIKENYGVEYVGVWHAFTGYWFGIAEDGELYQENQDLFIKNQAGLILPSGEEEKAYRFFYKWHSWLKDQGVDFLKVDAQGNAFEFYKHLPEANEIVKVLHRALEQSVMENFGGNMINCMGLASLNMYSRASSAVVRNSDDFFPDKAYGFTDHILQNAYNAVFHDPLYYCDYDMWWTQHTSAKQSSVLRAISGGPIYISDKVGETDPRYLQMLLDKDGYIKRCDHAARPTIDCLFSDPRGKVLKLFNTYGGEYITAAFDLARDGITVFT